MCVVHDCSPDDDPELAAGQRRILADSRNAAEPEFALAQTHAV